jgi:hypothetical protein
MISISASVGQGGTNRPVDVMAVQYLLNLSGYDKTGLTFELYVDGDADSYLVDGIKTFQRNVVGSKSPDGKVDAGGTTFTKLVKADSKSSSALTALRAVTAASGPYTAIRGGELSSSLGIIDTPRFVLRCDAQFGQQGAAYRTRVTEFVEFMNGDSSITDVGWAAYMFATAKWESGFEPIRETTRGKGKTYGNPVTVTDPSTGKKYTNTYYGRGYVQLTWSDNYLNVGKGIGLGNRLQIDPDLALDPDIAYRVMSYGMRIGTFTAGKHKLSDHINRSKCDYTNARRMINGTDNASAIASLANRYELLLRASCNESYSDCDVGIFV